MATGNGFDGWLEQELQRETARVAPLSTATARYEAAYRGGVHRTSVLAKAAAAVTAKGAIGLAFGALAVSAAGMAGEASLSGSSNPANWGQQVVQQVQRCKDALAPGSQGIGQCVSAFARKNGPAVSEDHRASGARENHASGARENLPDSSRGHGKGSPDGKDKSSPDDKGNISPDGKGDSSPDGKGDSSPTGQGTGHSDGDLAPRTKAPKVL